MRGMVHKNLDKTYPPEAKKKSKFICDSVWWWDPGHFDPDPTFYIDAYIRIRI